MILAQSELQPQEGVDENGNVADYPKQSDFEDSVTADPNGVRGPSQSR
jgi:hypothetical protein